MVVRISDKTQNYSKVTKLLVKPNKIENKIIIIISHDDLEYLESKEKKVFLI